MNYEEIVPYFFLPTPNTMAFSSPLAHSYLINRYLHFWHGKLKPSSCVFLPSLSPLTWTWQPDSWKWEGWCQLFFELSSPFLSISSCVSFIFGYFLWLMIESNPHDRTDEVCKGLKEPSVFQANTWAPEVNLRTQDIPVAEILMSLGKMTSQCCPAFLLFPFFIGLVIFSSIWSSVMAELELESYYVSQVVHIHLWQTANWKFFCTFLIIILEYFLIILTVVTSMQMLLKPYP